MKKKTNEVYDNLVDNYLMHSGRKGQKKGVHQFGKWQSQAVYAQGRPNPDAKVRGQKEKEIQRLAKKADYDGDAMAGMMAKALSNRRSYEDRGKHQPPVGGWRGQSDYAKGGGTKESRNDKLSRLSNEITDAMLVGDKGRASKAAKELDSLKPTKAESKPIGIKAGLKESLSSDFKRRSQRLDTLDKDMKNMYTKYMDVRWGSGRGKTSFKDIANLEYGMQFNKLSTFGNAAILLGERSLLKRM